VSLGRQGAESPADRRRDLKRASPAGLGLVGVGLVAGIEAPKAAAAADWFKIVYLTPHAA
jgi:hypothetical protein